VVPRRPLGQSSPVGLAAQAYTELEWSIYPGAISGSGMVYEDDGETYDYLQGKSATTTLSYQYNASATLSVLIEPKTSGGYMLPTARSHTLRIPNMLPPTGVTVNGARPIGWSRYGGAGAGVWWYDGAEMAVVINLPSTNGSAKITVEVQLATARADGRTDGRTNGLDLGGLKGKLAAARRAKAVLNLRRMAPGEHSGSPDPKHAPLARTAATGEHLGLLAGSTSSQVTEAVGNISTTFAAATSAIEDLAASFDVDKPDDKLRALYALDILKAAA